MTLRVLYVEDEDINWELTSLSLGQHFAMERAKSSREFYEILSRQEPDVILMDIQLQGSDISGADITQALNGRFRGTLPDYARGVVRPHIPIIFVTAYSSMYDRKLLTVLGAVDIVTKPVNFQKLKGLVEEVAAKSGR